MWRSCSPVAQNNHLGKCAKRIQRLLKSKLTSVNVSEKPLSTVGSSQPEGYPEPPLSVCYQSGLTDVNYSAARKLRFFPCNVSPEVVDALYPLPIGRTKNEIEPDIEEVLEDKTFDTIGALKIYQFTFLHERLGNERSTKLWAFLRHQALDISDIRRILKLLRSLYQSCLISFQKVSKNTNFRKNCNWQERKMQLFVQQINC